MGHVEGGPRADAPRSEAREAGRDEEQDGPAEVEAAEPLAALEAEEAEEVERSGAVSAFDEEPVTE